MAPVIFLVSAVTLVVIRRLRSAGDTDNVGPPPPQDPVGGLGSGGGDEYLQLEGGGGGGHMDSAVIYTTSEAPVGAGAGAGYPWPGQGPGRGDYGDPRVRTQAHVKLNPLFHQYS